MKDRTGGQGINVAVRNGTFVNVALLVPIVRNVAILPSDILESNGQTYGRIRVRGVKAVPDHGMTFLNRNIYKETIDTDVFAANRVLTSVGTC